MQAENVEEEQNQCEYNDSYDGTSRHGNSNYFSNSNSQNLNSQNSYADQHTFYTCTPNHGEYNSINQNYDMNDTAVYVNDFLINSDREILCINQHDPRNQLFTYKCQHIFDGECFMNVLTGHDVLHTSLKDRVVFDKHGIQKEDLNINDVYIRAGKSGLCCYKLFVCTHTYFYIQLSQIFIRNIK